MIISLFKNQDNSHCRALYYFLSLGPPGVYNIPVTESTEK